MINEALNCLTIIPQKPKKTMNGFRFLFVASLYTVVSGNLLQRTVVDVRVLWKQGAYPECNLTFEIRTFMRNSDALEKFVRRLCNSTM